MLLHHTLRGENTGVFLFASDVLFYWDPFEIVPYSLPASAGAQCHTITAKSGARSGVELGVGLVLRTKFRPWDVVELLISAGLNSRSPVVCVFQEMEECRFLLQ